VGNFAKLAPDADHPPRTSTLLSRLVDQLFQAWMMRRLMNNGMEGGRGRRRSIEDEMEMMRCIDEYTEDALGGREIRARQ